MSKKVVAECTGKIAYTHKEKAFKTALRQHKRGYAVHVYRCSFCANWHVGRTTKQPAKIEARDVYGDQIKAFKQ